MKFSELQDKQVVNIRDGKMVGRVEDLDLNPTDYRVQSFLVGKNQSVLRAFFSFLFPVSRIAVNLDQIVSVGEDVILIQPPTQRNR